MTKKIFLTLTLILISTSLFAASSKEAITKDFTTYSMEIEAKISEIMQKMAEKTLELNTAIDKDDSVTANKRYKELSKMRSELIIFMGKSAKKIKTPEIQKYHATMTEAIKVEGEMSDDIMAIYNKKGSLNVDDAKSVEDKFKTRVLPLQESLTLSLQEIAKIIGADLNKVIEDNQKKGQK